MTGHPPSQGLLAALGHAPGVRTMIRYRLLLCRGAMLLTVAMMAIMAFFLLERQLLFYPTKYPRGSDWSPSSLPWEDVFFSSADGTSLHGWYIPHEDAKAVVLYCHGNAGNITHRTPILELLHGAGLSVFIFDYRGYGRSEGRPGERGIYADARAARAWVAQREGIAERDVVLLGRSLGGAVAVELAATDGARALVLESTFTSVPDMMRRQFPYLPLTFLIRNRFDSIGKIGRYGGPLFLSHGDADTLVPYEQGRMLFDTAGGPKEFFTVPGGGHNDPQPPIYYVRLVEFLETHP